MRTIHDFHRVSVINRLDSGQRQRLLDLLLDVMLIITSLCVYVVFSSFGHSGDVGSYGADPQGGGPSCLRGEGQDL
jgi:hypothetical protein